MQGVDCIQVAQSLTKMNSLVSVIVQQFLSQLSDYQLFSIMYEWKQEI